MEEAETLVQWADEYADDLLSFQAPLRHASRNYNKLHIHIGPVDHITIME